MDINEAETRGDGPLRRALARLSGWLDQRLRKLRYRPEKTYMRGRPAAASPSSTDGAPPSAR